MHNLSDYTGPVVNVEAPGIGFSSFRFHCPECERRFNDSGAIWRVAAVRNDFRDWLAAWPPTVDLLRVVTYSNGIDRVEIFAGQCPKCETVYQGWRTFINVSANELMARLVNESMSLSGGQSHTDIRDWHQA